MIKVNLEGALGFLSDDELRGTDTQAALDKLETNIHEITRGAEFFDYPEFIAYYPKKAVENFPELKTFYRELLKHMKSEYTRVGHAWKEEYEL